MARIYGHRYPFIRARLILLRQHSRQNSKHIPVSKAIKTFYSSSILRMNQSIRNQRTSSKFRPQAALILQVHPHRQTAPRHPYSPHIHVHSGIDSIVPGCNGLEACDSSLQTRKMQKRCSATRHSQPTERVTQFTSADSLPESILSKSFYSL
jgi:hypothetical protein